jgi:hypothetical protein
MNPSAWNPIFPPKNKQIPIPILPLQDPHYTIYKKNYSREETTHLFEKEKIENNNGMHFKIDSW